MNRFALDLLMPGAETLVTQKAGREGRETTKPSSGSPTSSMSFTTWHLFSGSVSKVPRTVPPETINRTVFTVFGAKD